MEAFEGSCALGERNLSRVAVFCQVSPCRYVVIIIRILVFAVRVCLVVIDDCVVYIGVA